MKLSEIAILITTSLFLIAGIHGEPPSFIDNFCVSKTSGNYTQNSFYQKNLNSALSNLASQSTSLSFYNTTTGTTPDNVYALFICRYDLPTTDCSACIKSAITELTSNCTKEKEAIAWYEQCTLRYANRNIFSLEEEFPRVAYYSLNNVSMDLADFKAAFSKALDGLINQAAYNTSSPLYFKTLVTEISSFYTLYVLVQCTPDISAASCDRCLRTTVRDKPRDGSKWLMYFQPSCQMRYDLVPFFELPVPSPTPPPPPSTSPSSSSSGKEGVLKNGQHVAVKRLSKASGQGVKEFKTEVEVVAQLQHRNLVRLVGYCVEGEERLVVYEFLPNLSLDNFLFGSVRGASLTWPIRYKIIVGIARGLHYLHEDSRIKIVHRDLKASNILLDDNLDPKVADFGMARLMQVNQTQAMTTRVVGTFGYIAPEYALAGRCTPKSDIYSFGVIILEILSGKSCSQFYQRSHGEGLLRYAWRVWTEDTIEQLVDPILQSNYSRNEVERCIRIGLLCVQDDEANRPTTQALLIMLSSNSAELPSPFQPALLSNSIGMPSEGSDPQGKQGSYLESDPGNTDTNLYMERDLYAR